MALDKTRPEPDFANNLAGNLDQLEFLLHRLEIRAESFDADAQPDAMKDRLRRVGNRIVDLALVLTPEPVQ